MRFGKARSEQEAIVSRNSSNINPSAGRTWSHILGAITARADAYFQYRVVPGVNSGRFTRGTLLVNLDNKLQPKM